MKLSESKIKQLDKLTKQAKIANEIYPGVKLDFDVETQTFSFVVGKNEKDISDQYKLYLKLGILTPYIQISKFKIIRGVKIHYHTTRVLVADVCKNYSQTRIIIHLGSIEEFLKNGNHNKNLVLRDILKVGINYLNKLNQEPLILFMGHNDYSTVNPEYIKEIKRLALLK